MLAYGVEQKQSSTVLQDLACLGGFARTFATGNADDLILSFYSDEWFGGSRRLVDRSCRFCQDYFYF